MNSLLLKTVPFCLALLLAPLANASQKDHEDTAKHDHQLSDQSILDKDDKSIDIKDGSEKPTETTLHGHEHHKHKEAPSTDVSK